MFVQNSMNSELRKRYTPQSDNEKTLWDMFPSDTLGKKIHGFSEHGSYMDEEDFFETKVMNPSIFIFSMSLKFQACLKAWAFACSNGLKRSSFVREYFFKSIGSSGETYKYALSHWDHLNKAIC